MFEVAVVTRKYMFWKKTFSKTQWASEQFCWFYSKKLKFWKKNTLFWTILSFIEYQKDSNFVKTWIFADLESQNLQNQSNYLSGKKGGSACIFPYDIPPPDEHSPPTFVPPHRGGGTDFQGGNKLAGGGIKLFPPHDGGGMSENRPKSAFPPLDGGGISKIIKIEGGEWKSAKIPPPYGGE